MPKQTSSRMNKIRMRTFMNILNQQRTFWTGARRLKTLSFRVFYIELLSPNQPAILFRLGRLRYYLLILYRTSGSVFSHCNSEADIDWFEQSSIINDLFRICRQDLGTISEPCMLFLVFSLRLSRRVSKEAVNSLSMLMILLILFGYAYKSTPFDCFFFNGHTEEQPYTFLRRMKQSSENEKVICEFCGKMLECQLSAKLHRKVVHGEGNKQDSSNLNQTDSSEEEDNRKNVKKQPQKPAKKVEEAQSFQAPPQPKKHAFVQSKKTVSTLKKKERAQDTQQTLNKKYFICGCAHKIFQGAETLIMHIKKMHSGFPPDGSLFGVTKSIVLKHFKPPEDFDTIGQTYYEPKMFTCGCGNTYSCSSSLSYHIRMNHNGFEPINYEPQPLLNADEYDQQVKFDGENCCKCLQVCEKGAWLCQSCPDWLVCGICEGGLTQKKQHQEQGHTVTFHY